VSAETLARVGAPRPLVVGDRLDTDIAGALGVGIPAIWLRHPEAKLIPGIMPTHTITGLRELPDWLTAIAA